MTEPTDLPVADEEPLAELPAIEDPAVPSPFADGVDPRATFDASTRP